MATFYYYDTGYPKAPASAETYSQKDRGFNYSGEIQGSVIERSLQTIDYVIVAYGSGLVKETSDGTPPRIRIAEVALSTHEIKGVHPRAMPYVHFEMPTEEFADNEQWLAKAQFYYNDSELTHCITWLKNNTVKVTRYGSNSGSEYLTSETAEGLASDLEALSDELTNSYFEILDPHNP